MKIETTEYTSMGKILADVARQINQTPGSEATVERGNVIQYSKYSTNNGAYLGTYYFVIDRVTPTGNGKFFIHLKEITHGTN